MHKQDLRNIKQNSQISAKESLGLYLEKLHKPWFDAECSRFLDQRKQANMQWLQDTNQATQIIWTMYNM